MAKTKLVKDKAIIKIIEHIEAKVGSEATGVLIAILADSLDNLTKGESESRNIRCMEIKYNDYFTTKYDFEKNEYVEDGEE